MQLHECNNIVCIKFAVQMFWYISMLCECCSVRGPQGQEEASTPHEVAGMSFTINKATVLD